MLNLAVKVTFPRGKRCTCYLHRMSIGDTITWDESGTLRTYTDPKWPSFPASVYNSPGYSSIRMLFASVIIYKENTAGSGRWRIRVGTNKSSFARLMAYSDVSLPVLTAAREDEYPSCVYGDLASVVNNYTQLGLTKFEVEEPEPIIVDTDYVSRGKLATIEGENRAVVKVVSKDVVAWTVSQSMLTDYVYYTGYPELWIRSRSMYATEKANFNSLPCVLGIFFGPYKDDNYPDEIEAYVLIHSDH